MNSDTVSRIQNRLRFIFEKTGMPLEISVDGIFGEETAQAVREFQQSQGFPPSGELDERTLNSITDTYYRLLEEDAPPLAVRVLPGSAQPLAFGSRGIAQTVLNVMLGSLRLKFPNLPEITSIDTVGADTAEGIALIQRISGLEVTGIADKRTWNAAVRLFNAFFGGTR